MQIQNKSIKITPRARRTMRGLGIDAATVKGTGPGGRIVEADVRRGGATGTSSMRQAIARLTSQSFATVPHFYLRAEIDAAALVEQRGRMIEPVQRDVGVKVTISDFILLALARALAACPFANCIWQNDSLLALPDKNVGLVVGLSDGLLIPILSQADHLALSGVAQRRANLVEAARAGRVPGDVLQARAACSLSNLGNSRVDEFAAIIPPPQSSILAVGRIASRPFVVQDQLCVRPTMKLCLSVDHRVMDGQQGAEFLGKIVEALGPPFISEIC